MELLSDRIRLFARLITGAEDFEVEEIKVFFDAPDPHRPNSETLNIEENKPGEANFQWIAFQTLFTKGDNYYIYNTPLEPNGSGKAPDKVFESDSNWSSKNKDRPSREVSTGDIKRAFPKLLRGPDLIPPKDMQTVYINTDKSDKGSSYSSQEFKRLFDNDFYVVLNPKKKDLKNPFGKTVGISYPKEKTEK